MGQVYSAPNTTFTFPFSWSGTGEPVLRVMKVLTGETLAQVSFDSSAGTVTVAGDHTATELVFGFDYLGEYRFSRPVVKDRGASGEQSVPISEGFLTLNFWSVNYVDTGGFYATVEGRNGVTRTYTFAGPLVTDPQDTTGQLRSGTMKFPVRERADQADLEITLYADQPYPAHFINAGWEGFHTLRSSRF